MIGFSYKQVDTQNLLFKINPINQTSLKLFKYPSIIICQDSLYRISSPFSNSSKQPPFLILSTNSSAQPTIFICSFKILCCSKRYTTAKYQWYPNSLERSFYSFYFMEHENSPNFYSNCFFIIFKALTSRYRSITQKMESGYSEYSHIIARLKTSSYTQNLVRLTLNLRYFFRATSCCTARSKGPDLYTNSDISNLMNRWLYLLCYREMPQRMSSRRLGNLPQQKYTWECGQNWSFDPHTIRNSSNLSLGHAPQKQLVLGSTSGCYFLFCFYLQIFRCLSPQAQRLDPSWQQNCFTSLRYFTNFGCTFFILSKAQSQTGSLMAAYSSAQTFSRKGKLTSSLKCINDSMQVWWELYSPDTLLLTSPSYKPISLSQKSSSSQLTSEASYDPSLVSASSYSLSVISLGQANSSCGLCGLSSLYPMVQQTSTHSWLNSSAQGTIVVYSKYFPKHRVTRCT